VLTRAAINTALRPSPPVGTSLPPALTALSDCGLADQVEQIKITPASLSTEEMSKLWSAFQAHYRPTAAYLATVVLIEPTRPARSPLPVLSRGPVDPATQRDRGVVVQPDLLPPLPAIGAVSPPGKQPAAVLGNTVDITGHHLNGTNRVVRLANARFNIDTDVPALAAGGYDLIQFVVPNIPANFPVGLYVLSARMVRPGETEPRTTNSLPLVIAPEITTALPLTVARDGTGTATISLSCAPEIRPGQRASLALGEHEVSANLFSAATASLSFVFRNAPAGTFLVRLRVDNIDSAIINHGTTPPSFFDRRITIT
jgi:hypothetical protein